MFFLFKDRPGDGVSDLEWELLSGKKSKAIAGDIPGRQGQKQADEQHQAEIGAVEFAGGNRARVRWQVDMHDRKGASGRQAKGKDWAIQAAGDGKDNRQHHDKTSVEEYREAP